jgi:hypothetical protein
VLAPEEVEYFKRNNTVHKVISHLRAIQEDLKLQPWVLMDRPVLDPTKLAEATRAIIDEREKMQNICQSSLVRKMQGRTGEIIERVGWRIANDAEVRGTCIATDCPEVAPFVCAVVDCKAYCCTQHGPDHHLHSVWATSEALTRQRDERRAASVIVNNGRGRGGRGRGGRNCESGNGQGSNRAEPANDRGGQGDGRGEQGDGRRGGRGRQGDDRNRAGVSRGQRGGRTRRGRIGGRSEHHEQRANVQQDAPMDSLVQVENSLALLATLLRSHLNLISQLSSLNGEDTNTNPENVLDEWLI